MTEQLSSSTIEDKVRAALSTPEPDPLFVDHLEAQLLTQAGERPDQAKRRSAGGEFPGWPRRLAWGVALLLLALLAVFLVVGPQRVLAAFRQVFGYIPGVGIVEQNTPIRVLAEPASLTRDGITLSVTEAYLTPKKTILVYSIENVPNSALSHDENVVGCSDPGSLRLPDGTMLKITGGGGSGYSANYTYPPIPAGVQEARFILPCIQETLPGKAPEDWELLLHFVPAPPELTAAPIIDLATPTPPATRPERASQAQPTPGGLYGIQIALDQAIPLADGYYLIGHTHWTDERIASAYPGAWAMKVFDAGNQEIPLEPANFRDVGMDQPEPNQWIYRLYGKAFNGPLTLRTTLVGVEFAQAVQFELDPRFYGFDGSEAQLGTIWKIDPITLDVPGSSLAAGMRARVVQMKYMQIGELKGFELGIEAEPALRSLQFGLESAVTGGRGASGGGSNRDATSGLIFSYVLSDGQMSLPLSFSARSGSLAGVWETTWTPPAGDPNVTLTPVPQACLTLEGWKQAVRNPAPLPDGLTGRLLLSRGASAPDPSLFLSSLDGRSEQGLVFGYGSLSPDGAQLAYSDEAGKILILDLNGGRKMALTSGPNDFDPLWSPDGRQIAFTRFEGSRRIFVMDVDGANLRPLTPAADTLQLAGWSPDGAQILYWVEGEGRAAKVRLVEAASGRVTDLVEVQLDAPSPAFSPDGRWIAYLDRVPGRMADGLYLSRLDGTERRLVVQLDYWSVGNVAWSPDGKWLAFSVLNTDLITPTSTAGLLNVATCQVIPLANLDGAIQSWVNP